MRKGRAGNLRKIDGRRQKRRVHLNRYANQAIADELERAEDDARDFKKYYIIGKSLERYLSACEVSTLETIAKRHKPMVLKGNESWTDPCIVVDFASEPPKKLRENLPASYRGRRVVYEISGEATFLRAAG